MNSNLENSIKFLSKKYNSAKLAIVQGGGLASLTEMLTEKTVISYSDIPSFPESTRPDYKGELIFGKFKNIPVVMMNGHLHYYEGHSAGEITEYLEVLKELGVESVLFTNSVGSLSRGLHPGDLLVLTDHINITSVDPLRGQNDSGKGVRFVNMTDCYLPKNVEAVYAQARKSGIPIKSGIYAYYLGPSFQTASEIKMLHALGADVVGMSTVPDVIMARYLDLDVTAISCVTNYGTGITGEAVTIEEVLDATNRSNRQLCQLISHLIQNYFGNYKM
jgi:purine-nucleoside phosphorylase